ncbi:hypothetical protein [Nostoc piscinale]|uniref:hypothetical protein n=1 Tax=Nostoc piscinale TaxID=224012 RepID=UPI0039A61EF1
MNIYRSVFPATRHKLFSQKSLEILIFSQSDAFVLIVTNVSGMEKVARFICGVIPIHSSTSTNHHFDCARQPGAVEALLLVACISVLFFKLNGINPKFLDWHLP